MIPHTCVACDSYGSRRDAPIIIASGFLATLAMTTIMYVLPALHLGQVDAPLWAARLFVTDPVAAAAAGLTIDLFVGFGYAWLFSRHVEPRLATGPMRTSLLFGVALWTFAQVVAVRALGALADLLHGGAIASPGLLARRRRFGESRCASGVWIRPRFRVRLPVSGPMPGRRSIT